MKKLTILFTVITVIFLTGVILWRNNIIAVNSNDKTQKIFIVKNHENIRDIAYNLKKEDLIKNPITFFLIIKKLGLDNKIQAGNFRLSPSMTTTEIATALTHGTLDVWITITGGKRAEEVAEIFSNNMSMYDISWKKKLIEKEGFLFPDTYLIPKDASIDLVINLLNKNFEEKFQKAYILKTTNLTREQAVILASIVEREAKSPQEMRLVASVLENRLKINMPLQVDATIQYALGYQPIEQTWWKKNLTLMDLKINSPYNTYENTGLPIGPISSPEFNALSAVLNPEKTDYIYYISDKNGQLHFAKNLEEHNRNIQNYGK